MVFSLLPTVVFASETETSTTVYDWDQENACYKSTTDGLIKYNDNDPDGSLPEPLQTLYSNINAADDEAAKVAAIDSAKNAGTITENLANRLKQLVHVYTRGELASGVSLQNSSFTATLEGNELVIRGTGALPTYTRYNDAFWAPADNSVAMRPWNTEKLGTEVSSVRFAPGITEVGAYAFYYQERSDITSATFNKNLKLRLPDSLTKMSQATFMSLNAFDITVPSSVTTLSTRLFSTLSRLYVLGDPDIVVPSVNTSSFAVGSGTTVYAAKDSKLSNTSGITKMTLVEVDAIGACGTEEDYTSELVWMVQDDTLTIAAMDGGNGVMADYTDENPAPWNAYASQIRKIVLSAGVANIGTKAFAGLNSLTNVTVPDSVQIDKNDESPFGTTLNLISFSFNEGSSFADWLKEKGIDHSADVDDLGRKKLNQQRHKANIVTALLHQAGILAEIGIQNIRNGQRNQSAAPISQTPCQLIGLKIQLRNRRRNFPARLLAHLIRHLEILGNGRRRNACKPCNIFNRSHQITPFRRILWFYLVLYTILILGGKN